MDFKDVASIGANILEKALLVAQVISPILPAGGLADGLKLATTIGTGLVKSEPAIIDLFEEIKKAAEGAEPPTAEQWAEWNARVDTAHAEAKAALAS